MELGTRRSKKSMYHLSFIIIICIFLFCFSFPCFVLSNSRSITLTPGFCPCFRSVCLTLDPFPTSYHSYPKLGLPVPKLEVTDSGAKPKAILEEMGGSVKLVWFARVPLRAHFKPHKFDILPKSNGVSNLVAASHHFCLFLLAERTGYFRDTHVA